MRAPDSLIQLLLARLERISVDSHLAHRASGIRGSLVKLLEARNLAASVDASELDRSLSAAMEILGRAAAALPKRRRS